ncbi:MAG: hypothetical protein GXY55_01720 [Phycisphaerae bacterium]|nr:hypothetical protein [Phycisphaerae bacterium]
MPALKIKHVLKGRAVGLNESGQAYLSRNYRVGVWRDGSETTPVAVVPCPMRRRLIEPSRLLCRLLRHEIRGYQVLPDGSRVAASRHWLYHGRPGELVLSPARVDGDGPKAPMTITLDCGGRILWGEYWSNAERRGVRLFVSTDGGRSYEPFHEFAPGEIRHVHNIIEDRYDGGYWVMAGDHGAEPGIGRLSADLKSFEWVVKGEQKYRAVSGFVFPDRLVYGTDTEKDFNAIHVLDKRTGRTEKVVETPGSCIYAARFGRWYTVSTTVEYFEKYDNRHATIWVSENALDWREVYRVEKDVWSIKYFQFGSIVLPRGEWDRNVLIFSGQALKKIDNRICIAEVVEEA